MRKPSKNYLDTALIERAEAFHATIFLGTGKYRSEASPTLAEARRAAVQITAEARNGRRALIYASCQGRSVLVPDDYQPQEGTDTMTATDALTGTEISMLTAILTGGGHKRANSKESAAKRFLTVAAAKAIPGAADYLSLPYADAASRLRNAMAPEPAPQGQQAAQGQKPRIEAASEMAPAAQKAAAPGKAPLGKRAAILAAAQRGELPAAPDFTADTHKLYRKKLATVVALVEARDVEGLKAFHINPVSSSPKAIAKFRDLCVIALAARTTTEDAA